jgi:hypothetical protein
MIEANVGAEKKRNIEIKRNRNSKIKSFFITNILILLLLSITISK